MDIPLDKKVLLYAPTWRDDLYHSIGHYKFQLPLDLNLMKEKLSEEFVIILRMHYLVTEDLDIEPYEGFIYNFTDYEDIRDLYLVADVLITDYSSVFFDFANLKRPIIFFTFDLERYRDKLRGFYLDFEKYAPGPIVKCTEELIAEINELNNKGFQIPKSADDFFKRFCYLESGESSKKVIESIFVERYIK
jgi:CDP-glycerol glycerophosphotransferase